MFIRRIRFFIPMLFFVLTLSGQAEQLVDYVVAAVNEEAITWSALELERRSLELEMRKEKTPVEESKSRRLALDRLIDRRLYLQEARNFILIPNAEVEARVAERLKPPNALADLAKQGLTAEDARKQARENLMLDQLIARNFRLRINEVSKTDVEAYYVEHQMEYVLPEQYNLQIIRLRFEPQREDEAKERVEALRRQLQESDIPVAELTRQGFRVTDSGWSFGRDFPADVEKAVTSLKVGTFSEPMVIAPEVWLVKLTDKKPSQPQPLEQAREDITRRVIIQRVEAVMTEWLSERKRQSDIRILDPALVRSEGAEE